MPTRSIRLIHWHAAGAEAKMAAVRAAGYEVACSPLDAALLRELRLNPPLAVVIDLDRQPSSGRDLALNLRQYTSTRHVPLVLAGGEPGKVAPIRELLPDAVYTSWADVVGALARAIAHPPAEPIVPGSVFAAYAGVPLAKKLGIGAGYRVALAGAPEGVDTLLEPLPEGVTLVRDLLDPRDLTLWFVRSQAELESGLPGMVPRAGRGRLWVAWPKKASGVATDLTQSVVRRLGLAAGLMDYKVCSIDATWTGLRFTLARGGGLQREA